VPTLLVQEPWWHCWVLVHAVHVAPLMPHVCALEVWHVPVSSQQPVQLDASHDAGLLHDNAPKSAVRTTARAASLAVVTDPP
jgi:hypothetical protein